MHLSSVCALLVAGALTVPFAACGGSDDASGSSDAATEESREDNAQDTARTKLEQCLRDQGLEIPAGRSSGSGGRQQLSEADREQLREAMDGPCAKHRDEAFSTAGVSEDRQEFEDAAVKFQACMRDEGIDVPDQPGASAGGAQIDPNDPDVQAAMEKCQEFRPGNGGR